MTARTTPTTHEGDAPPFLDGIPLRKVALTDRWPFTPTGLALGCGASALEVLVATHLRTPSAQDLRAAWKVRHGGRAAPLLLVVLYDKKAALCGPAGDDPPARLDLDPGQLDRICREALDEPDRHTALRALRDSLPALDTDLGGVRNEGFLASHELRAGARRRSDWRDATTKASRILGRQGPELLKALGFQIESCDRVTSILRSKDRKVAIAVLLNRDESPELQAGRFADISPVSYALAVADRENLPYVVIQHGAKVRVYPARVGVGVGRRGRTETYVECHAGLLNEDNAALLWLLCSADALLPGGSLEDLIAASGRFSGDLAAELRERIYQSVVPQIARGLVAAREQTKPTTQDLADTYEMALVVLFRLLFIAYAEDKDLLPYRWNELYRNRSLKKKAQEVLELARSAQPFDTGDSLWEEVRRLFRAVDVGNREWGVPPYNGGLFTEDAAVSRVGALLAPLRLPNTILGPALRDLLLVETEHGLGPVDFRSLGVREFGTIYEGLLESELAVAEADLAVDKEGVYRPCRSGETALVRKGDVYLHNASGARKSSGSYFTKSFAVEHLLERTLEPALLEHLARLDAVSTEEASDRFFDFRVADIAMGSGHFLVAAIDHIEKGFSGYLAGRKLPNVMAELATLRAAAVTALGSLAEQVEIEDTQLLRRLIARRCIYGVDINPTSVQLARLAVWIHTFVAGLPLSLLDHNLVPGNSLVGIGRLDEVKSAIEEESLPLFPIDATYLLGAASEPLKRLARIADATPSDLARARKASAEALEAVVPASALCDLVTAARITGDRRLPKLDGWEEIRAEILGSLEWAAAKQKLKGLQPFHFPVAFPEVFLRSRPGFDVILGNPPWEEAMCDVNEFWARHVPGFRGLPQREQEALLPKLRSERPDLERAFADERRRVEVLRSALEKGAYPGMGTGHPDLYKAFCWRFWMLACEEGGRIGVVLPRSALSAKGSTEFRREAFKNAECVDVTMLLNRKEWLFERVHEQYAIGLVALTRRSVQRTRVELRGPYPSLDRYLGGVVCEATTFYGEEIQSWNDTASLPLLPTDDSVEVFAQLRKSPRLDLNEGESWRARPIQGDLNATWGKPLMDLISPERPRGFWPVFKGESFDLWTPETGTYYAWADPNIVLPHLQERRRRGARTRTSPFHEFAPSIISNPETLPILSPRIAIRDVTNRLNERTLIAALVPPEIVLGNQAPFLLWPRGSARDEAFLLGVLSSLVLDWYARRFVERHLNFFIFNPFPVPRPNHHDSRWQRVVALAGRLACPDVRFAQWAASVAVECGPLRDDVKQDMIHELDAIVAHLYGLDEKHVTHIFETFHEGWDFETRLKETRKHFRDWKRRAGKES
jgi:hypothetical protein